MHGSHEQLANAGRIARGRTQSGRVFHCGTNAKICNLQAQVCTIRADPTECYDGTSLFQQLGPRNNIRLNATVDDEHNRQACHKVSHHGHVKTLASALSLVLPVLSGAQVGDWHLFQLHDKQLNN
jgi:hypothetical protein